MTRIRALVRQGTMQRGRSTRCSVAAAFKNKGVQPLLDAVVDFLPSPVDIPAIQAASIMKTERRDQSAMASDDEPLSMLAFKVMNDPFVGSLTFRPHLLGQDRDPARRSLINTVKDKRERVGRMLQMHSNSREDIEDCLCRRHRCRRAGLKETTTGDTLCDAN